MPFDHLWTTWRARYVTGLSDTPTAEDPPDERGSLFERILAAEGEDIDKGIVYRGERTFVIVNRYPYTSGHTMVLPYRAVVELDDLDPAEFEELWQMVRLVAQATRSAFAPHGLNIGVNLGAASGGSQSDHLHVHVVPRWIGDTNFLGTTAEVRTMPFDSESVVAALRASWPVA